MHGFLLFVEVYDNLDSGSDGNVYFVSLSLNLPTLTTPGHVAILIRTKELKKLSHSPGYFMKMRKTRDVDHLGSWRQPWYGIAAQCAICISGLGRASQLKYFKVRRSRGKVIEYRALSIQAWTHSIVFFNAFARLFFSILSTEKAPNKNIMCSFMLYKMLHISPILPNARPR